MKTDIKWKEYGSYPNWDMADAARNQLKDRGVYEVKIVSDWGIYRVYTGG